MNNPWLSLIAVLSGERVNAPLTWPVREVHRLCEIRACKPAEGSQAHPSRHRGLMQPAR
ncbi:MAG: hypothetical protein ABI520_09065 [Caldimonas sp.]